MAGRCDHLPWPKHPSPALRCRCLDGDYYESTIQGPSRHSYDKFSPDGFVIIDDYFTFEPCREAVEDFRVANGIVDEIVPVDQGSVYWRTPLY